MKYSILFEQIYFKCRIEPLIEQTLKEVENNINNININDIPEISIKVNTEENNIIARMKNSTTDQEQKDALEIIKNYYIDYFNKNYENTTAINDATGIKVKLVKTGLKHCFQQGKYYYLWPAIRYLPLIIKIATYTTETSQHTNDPNTTRGNIAHIFYCKGNYIFNTSGNQITETHILRISSITFKKGTQSNFRHIGKFTENQNNINSILVSFEIQ